MAGDHLVWDPNPFLIQSDLINVRWYGVLFLGGFLVGQWLVHKHFRRDGLDEGNIPALFNTMFFSTLIGARLGHCFFYEPQHYLLNPLEIPQFWKGGLASHGGMVGIFIGLWWYRQRRRELTYLGLLDVLSLPAAITCAAIRFGNLMNSEIIGHRSQVPWAMVFPAVDGEHGLPRHPVQLYEALCYLSIFFFLKAMAPRWPTGRGQTIGAFLTLMFLARFLMEFFKLPQAEYASALPLNLGALLSLPPLAIGLWLWWRGGRTA